MTITTKTRSRGDRDALEAYPERRAEIEDLLERIRAGVAAHQPEDRPIDWCHVGDLADVRRKLGDVSDMLLREGEYAHPVDLSRWVAR